MNELNSAIAKNLTTLRKKSQLTQMQLAEKLNYSDKAVSKWEKGDCIPNVNVLMTLANFYGVKIQDIVYENKSVQPKKNKKTFRIILSGLSGMLVWLIATIVFVVLKYIPSISNEWLAFIVAIPVSFLVLTVFFGIYRWKIASSVMASLFVWTSIMAISLMLQEYKVWIVYIIGIPLQIIIILSTLLDILHHRVKD
jgi:transcriptional regulator with XRE-family HTH domain